VEKRALVILIVGLCLAVLSGCGPTGIRQTTPATTTAPPPSPSPTAGNDVVIVYRREGGFTAMTETFAIHRDGTVDVENTLRGRQQIRRTLHAGPDDVDRLVAALDQANFSTLQDSYVPTNTCCDRAIHTITYFREGQVKSVTTIDANPNEPPALQAVMQALDEFLAQLQE